MGKNLRGLGERLAFGATGESQVATSAVAPMELDCDTAAAAVTGEDTATNQREGAAYAGIEVDDDTCELQANPLASKGA